ncbi:mCG140495 [Mus musculus]|nr:mCG140495 [Mus musculus]
MKHLQEGMRMDACHQLVLSSAHRECWKQKQCFASVSTYLDDKKSGLEPLQLDPASTAQGWG